MVCGGNVNNGRGGGGAVLLYKAANAELTDWRFVGVVYRSATARSTTSSARTCFRSAASGCCCCRRTVPCEYLVGHARSRQARVRRRDARRLDPGDAYASNISVDDTRPYHPVAVGAHEHGARQGLERRDGHAAHVVARRRRLPAPAAGAGVRTTARRRGNPPGRHAGARPARRLRRGHRRLPRDLGRHRHGEHHRRRRFRRPAQCRWQRATKIRILPPGVLAVGELRAPLSRGRARHTLRVFLDKRVFEVYANDGEAAIYGTIDAAPSAVGVAIAADPLVRREGLFGPPPPSAPVEPRVEGFTAWPLGPARFDPRGFWRRHTVNHARHFALISARTRVRRPWRCSSCARGWRSRPPHPPSPPHAR